MSGKSLEEVCRLTVLELSPGTDRIFAAKLNRFKEKIAANRIARFFRAKKPRVDLMLRVIENNKIIKSEIQSLRKELEFARRQKLIEAQAETIREGLRPEFSPLRSCRLLLKEPLTSPASLEHLVRVLGTDPSAIRSTQLGITRTEISLVLCLTRCSPDNWRMILKNLPNDFTRDASFPEILGETSWLEEFNQANAIPPIWLPPSIEEPEQLSPTVSSFVDRLKSTVVKAAEGDKETLDAFGELGRRRRKRSEAIDYSCCVDKVKL